jgi:hypothetical protein
MIFEFLFIVELREGASFTFNIAAYGEFGFSESHAELKNELFFILFST